MLRISYLYSFKKERLKLVHRKMIEDQMDSFDHNDYVDEVYGRFAAVLQMKDLHLVDDTGLIFVSTKENQ